MLNVHDSVVKSYEIDLQHQKILFYLDSKNTIAAKTIKITFSDVLSHFFENVIKGSIIFDISKCEINSFIQNNKSLLEKGKPYCWPSNFSTLEEFAQMLLKEKYLCYEISSSYGLNGWILAKQYKIEAVE